MSPESDSKVREIQGRLIYVLENCQTALKELCKINKDLLDALAPSSKTSPQSLGDLNRMIQGYLIVCVASLFDSDKRSVSFAHAFRGDKEFESIKQESIIKEIIKNRHTWIAHNDKDGEIIPTAVICESNLGEILERLRKLLS
jgi:hypothetical protein